MSKVNEDRASSIPTAEPGNIKLSAAPSFTPGPWKGFLQMGGPMICAIAGPTRQLRVYAQGGTVSAEAEQANARLIIAAPDLYDSIDKAQARLDDLPDLLYRNGSAVIAGIVASALKELRATLALVEAQQ